MTTIKSPPRLVTLILLTAFSTLSLNMFLPSLANIAQDLDAAYSTVSLALAGYLAITAIIQLIVGPLSDRIGRRPVLISALIIFTIASIGCSLATDVWTFLFFRMFQGAMISGYALSLAMVRDTRSQREAAGLIGYISMAMAIAPMLGPMFGGVLDQAFGWRANFYFYSLVGLLLMLWCWFDVGETRPKHDVTSGEKPTNSMMTLILSPLFWCFSLCGAFSTGAFYIFLTGAPLVAKNQFGVTTGELGFFIGSITAGFMFGSFLSGRLAPRFQPTSMMLAGRLTACIGLSIGVLALLIEQVSPLLFFGSTIFVGLGNGITMPSASSAVMSIEPGLTGSAAGLNGAMIVAIGAILTSLTGLILPQEAPALTLLILMLIASVAGMLSVLVAMRIQSLSNQ
ncbi:MAG: multidrug effflux MFS transporter [Pseudomonadota bacterium]